MPNENNGQYRAWEVTRIDVPRRGDLLPAITTPIGTVWSEEEARKLDRLFNPNPVERDPLTPTSSRRIREIGVIIMGENAYYDTFLEPVPSSFIFETAEQAAALVKPYVDPTARVA